MNQRSRQILAELCSKHARASLVGFWADIRKLSKAQFLTELEKRPTSESTPQARRKKVRKGIPKDDTPGTRIAFVLRNEKKLAVREAQLRLSAALIQRGYPPATIPPAVRQGLDKWLDQLLQNVPSSDVMDAASNI